MVYYVVSYVDYEGETAVDYFNSLNDAHRQVDWLWWHEVYNTTVYQVVR